MMPDKRDRTGVFIDVPEKLKEEIKDRLYRMDQIRAGSIFPSTFEDGMRFVYLQLLCDIKRCKEIVEGYSRLRALDFQRQRITYDFRKKYEEEAMERIRKNG